jgi:hypothetical protein
MSYNGSGTFVINTTGQPVVTGTVISSTAFNALTADLGTGLSTAITKDGQTATTARIPFAQGISSTLVTDSTSTTTGSIITAGGAGVAKALFVGTTANVAGTTDSSSSTTGTITTAGGVGIAKALNVGTTLAVAGDSTFTGSVNAPNTFGFKNRIINGAMVLDQRNAGAAQTITAAAALAYTVDRWYGYCTGANVTGQQVAGSTTPTTTQNRYRFTGAASVTAVGFGQRIEQKNSYDLAGSTCTLSADLAISATLTTVTWTAYYATTTADTFGSLASPTVTSIATGTFTVGATVTNFSTNIAIPAAATTGIQILFTVGALTAGLTWTIGNVQLEKGSTATSFDYRPYGKELALCQRYLYAIRGSLASSSQASVGVGGWDGTAGATIVVPYPVQLRVFASSITVSSASDFQCVREAIAWENATAIALAADGNGVQAAALTVSTATRDTRGFAARMRSNSATAYLGFNAEL